jgi:hypothetical protein
MKKLTVLLIPFLALKWSGLIACTCIGERTVKEEIKLSDVIVTGKIISRDYITLLDSEAVEFSGRENASPSDYPITVARYKLLIYSSYKGKKVADTLEVYTGTGHGDCGVSFEVGKEYIVYGQKETYFGQENNGWVFPAGKNIIWTNVCSRTTAWNGAEIQEIERYRRPRRS